MKSGLYFSLARLLSFAFSFVFAVLLARELGPGAIGLMAVALIVVGVAELLSDFGITSALIQKPELLQGEISGAFWFSVCLGCFFSVGLWMLSPVLASLLGAEGLEALLYILSGKFAVVSIGCVPNGMLRRGQRFFSVGLIELASVFFSGAAALSLAYLGFGIVSLVVQSYLHSILFSCGSFVANKGVSLAPCSMRGVWALLPFTSKVFSFNFLNYSFKNLDSLLIARNFDVAAAGVYNRGVFICQAPVRIVSQTLYQVLFPRLARARENVEFCRHKYLSVLKLVVSITLPLYAGLGTVAQNFVSLLLGSQWISLAPILKWLCCVGFIQSVLNLNGAIYQSQGRAGVQLIIGSGVGTGGIILFVARSPFGPESLARDYFLYLLIVAVPSLIFAASFIRVSASMLFASMIRPVAATISMVVVISLMKILVGDEGAMSFLVCAILGAGTYFFVLRLIGVRLNVLIREAYS